LKSPIAFTSTRRDGNARSAAALRRILKGAKTPHSIATARQVHGTRIEIVPKLRGGRRYPDTDGLITDEKDQPLGIFTADCVPIFLSAPSQGVVGLLHAGWRGVRGGILPKALRLMRRRWQCLPHEVSVWVGPCIDRCCFEVQWDVAKHFPTTRQRRQSRWVVNLKKEIEHQVKRAGGKMRPGSPACTRHHSRYYSFRRDQTDHRQISVIMKKG